jgi:hypothetical protein
MSDFKIRIVCTDRGTHPSRELATLSWRGTLGLLLTEGGHDGDSILAGGDRVSHRRPEAVVASSVVDQEDDHPNGPLWRFRCRTCRRDKPLRDKGLRELIVRYTTAGLSRIDISHLR